MIERALVLLERLIAFDTTSSKSNLALIEWVGDLLAAKGIPLWRVAGPCGTKANLLARIGPDVAGGIVLSGHSDVVPVDGQPWTSDPWTLTERDGRLYGRGVADMKGFIALALAQALELSEREAQDAGLVRPLLIALTYDEEVGCLGAPHLLARLPDLVARPALAVIGEPTEMKVVSVHKGMRVFDVTVTGREAHSSQRDQGVSAIGAAIELMTLITRLNAQAGEAALRVDPLVDPCSPPGTTLSVGLVAGGTAANILARECRFTFDLRTTNRAEADRIEAQIRAAGEALDTRLRAIAGEAGVVIERRADAPPLENAPDSAAEQLVRGLTGDNGLAGAAFVAEAGLYQQAGIPAVLCGPGSILQAHQGDEWIALDQLHQGAAFLARLAQGLRA